MKKFIAIVSSACILFAAQSAMAFTGHVDAGDFSSEKAALNAGQQIAEEILTGKNNMVSNSVNQNCISDQSISYNAPKIVVQPTWKKATNGFEKSYEAAVQFSYSCTEEPRL